MLWKGPVCDEFYVSKTLLKKIACSGRVSLNYGKPGVSFSGWLFKTIKRHCMIKLNSLIRSLFKFGNLFQSSKAKIKAKPPSSSYISKQRMAEIEEVVRKHLEEKKSFLQHGYTLKMFSEETKIPLYQLSAFVNKYYKMNFNDFINEFRILFSIDKLLKKEWMYKKLETIADESGFNNRNTFISAFKKVTGVKPSEFLKEIKTGNVTNLHPGKIPAYKDL